MARLRDMDVKVGDVILYHDEWKDGLLLSPEVPCIIVGISMIDNRRQFALKQLFRPQISKRDGIYQAEKVGHIKGFVAD